MASRIRRHGGSGVLTVGRSLILLLVALTVTPASAQTGAKEAARAFLDAAARDDVSALRRLAAAGVPVDVRDGRGRTALLVATYNNSVAAARFLIRAGADVNAKDDLDDSAFLYAGAEGRLAILRLTLGAGADLASTNRYGGTALIPAAHHGHVETVRELLTTRIDKDHVNKLGWTALLEAIILGDGSRTYRDVVRMLVDAGANVNIPDGDGVTPLAHARRRGFADIAALLERVGARP